MSVVAAMDAELAAAVTDPATGFGEPITTATGETVYAVVRTANDPGLGLGLELQGRLDAQAERWLELPDDDADRFAAGDRITVRGLDAIVAEPPDPLGDGMSAVRLMAATDADDTDGGAQRWR